MAHCSSSFLHRIAFGAERAGHEGMSQGPLPPRMRLLAGLNHIAVGGTGSLPSPPLISPTATQPLCREQYGEATMAMAGHGPLLHSSPPPLYSLLHSFSHKCFACGDGGVLLHRIPCLSGGGSGGRYHCSSCVLSFNKHMYCFLCFQVFKEGSPSSSPSAFLTCCRCQRLSHLHCAHRLWSSTLEGAGLTLCIECYIRNNGSSSQSMEPPSKRRKIASLKRAQQASSSGSKVKFPVIDQQALIAARVVAAIAEREAYGAKQRAMAMARASVRAAAQAKIALDNAYHIGQKKREEEEAAAGMAMDSASKDEGEKSGGNAMAKTPKGFKRRALSAIVASETISKELAIANPASSSAMTLKQKKERRRPVSDDGVAGALSSHGAVADPTPGTSSLPSPSPAQSTKSGIKRRKTLSSLGLQHPTKTHASAKSKGSKSTLAKSKGSSSSTKGKLGAIFSQVLALSKSSKSSSKALDSAVRCSETRSAILDDNANKGVQQNLCRRDATTSSADVTSNTTLKLSQGHIAGSSNIDACNPSQHDVASYHRKVQSGRCLEASVETAGVMHLGEFLGNSPKTAELRMAQEQEKSRTADDEAVASEQERRLFNFLKRTMASSNLMNAKGVPTARITLKK